MQNKSSLWLVPLVFLVVVTSCRDESSSPMEAPRVRNHSFAQPHDIAITHMELDLTVDFENKRLHGFAEMRLDNKTGATKLYLDTGALLIHRVTIGEQDLPLLAARDYARTAGAAAARVLEPPPLSGLRITCGH